MSKWLLVAVAAATAALLLLLWRSLGEPAAAPSAATHTPASEKAGAANKKSARTKPKAVGSSQGPRKDAITGALIEKAEPRRKPTEKEIELEAISRFRSGPVVQELYARAATCYQDEPGRSEKMSVRYHLKVQDAQASVLSATMLSSTLANRRLEDCIVDALEGHSWPVADGFEVDEPDEQASFSILGLQKRVQIHARQQED